LSDISQEMNSIDAKIRRYAIEAKRAELTNRELDRLDDNMTIYRQVGRMWIRQPKKTLVENLKGTDALKRVEGQQMRQMRMKLEERARSEADGLKELIGVDRFKELFANAGKDKEDPSKALKEMNNAGKDDMMPIFGKRAEASKEEKKPDEGGDAKPAEPAEPEKA